jgi:thymidylate synthase ThyX
MHFLNLRTAPNAMHEIRVLAREAEAHFAEVMPHTYEAFLKNNRVAP